MEYTNIFFVNSANKPINQAPIPINNNNKKNENEIPKI